MARKFTVSLDLNKNELLNARLQNLSSDPSNPVSGQLYYNTQDNVTKFYDGTQWVSGGSTKYGLEANRPAASKGGTLYAATDTSTLFLDNGTSWIQISVNPQDLADAISDHNNETSGVHGVTGNVVGTSDSQTLTNKTINDELFFTNPSTIPNDGGLRINDTTEDFEINSYIADLNLNGHNNLNLSTTNGNIVLNPDGNAYIGSSANPDFRIATIGDLNSDAVIQSVSGTTNQIDASNSAGSVTLSLPSTINVSDLSIGNDAGSAITFNNGTGNIVLNPDTNVTINSTTNMNGTVNVEATLRVGGDSDGYLRVRDANDANSVIIDSGLNTNGSKALAIYDETHLKFVDTVNGIFTGTIKLNPVTSGQLEINSTGEIVMSTDGSQASGNIILNPDGKVVINGITDIANALNVESSVHIGGSLFATDGGLLVSNSAGVAAFDVDAQTLTTEISGTARFQSDAGNSILEITADANNAHINATNGNLVLQSDNGNSGIFLGSSSSSENRVATFGDLTSLSSGLSWKESVHLLYNDPTPTLSGDSVLSPLIIDGHDPLVLADSGYRILVTQGNDAGIYVYNQSGTAWTLDRAADADTFVELKGAAVFVMEGSQYGSTSWVQSSHYITDFTGQDWIQFSGQGTYIGSDSILIDGNQVSAIVDTTRGVAIDVDGVYAKIGNGIEFDGSGNLAINAGTGLTVSSGTLEFSSGYGVRKYTTTIGDNSATTFPLDHNFNTRHVTVQVFEAASPYAQVETDVERTLPDRVTIKFASAPGVGEYEVVIVG